MAIIYLQKGAQTYKEIAQFSINLSPTAPQTLILHTNFNFPVQAKIDFTPITKKVLSFTPISFSTKVLITTSPTPIHKITHQANHIPAPGYYRVTMRGKRIDHVAKIFNSLNYANWPTTIQHFYDPHLNFTLTTTVFISSMSKENFSQRLTRYFSKARLAEISTYRELIEKYQTIHYSLEQLKKLIIDHINHYSTPKDLKQFKQDYSTFFATLLQQMILQEERAIKKSSHTTKHDRITLLKLIKKSTKLGGKVIRTISNRKKYFSKRWKLSFITLFTNQIINIQNQINHQQKLLQNKITTI